MRASVLPVQIEFCQGIEELAIHLPEASFRMAHGRTCVPRTPAYSMRRKTSPAKTQAAATSNKGASGRKSAPTPTMSPAASAIYSALFRKGRWALFKRKSGLETLRRAITSAQQASAVQNVAKTSVNGTAV